MKVTVFSRSPTRSRTEPLSHSTAPSRRLSAAAALPAWLPACGLLLVNPHAGWASAVAQWRGRAARTRMARGCALGQTRSARGAAGALVRSGAVGSGRLRISWRCAGGVAGGGLGREEETERQRKRKRDDKQTDRQIDRQTGRLTDRKRDRVREGGREGGREGEGGRREREREVRGSRWRPPLACSGYGTR